MTPCTATDAGAVTALRSRWELAVVLDFLDLFRRELALGDTSGSPLCVTAVHLEAALMEPRTRENARLLEHLHVGLLRGLELTPRLRRGEGQAQGWWASALETAVSGDAWVALVGQRGRENDSDPFEVSKRATWNGVDHHARDDDGDDERVEDMDAIDVYRRRMSPAQRLRALWALCELRLMAEPAERVNAASGNPRKVSTEGVEPIDTFRATPVTGVDGEGFVYWLRGDVRGTGPRLYRAGLPSYDVWSTPAGCASIFGVGGGDEPLGSSADSTVERTVASSSSTTTTTSFVLPPHYDPTLTVEELDVPCMQCGGVEDEEAFVLCDACPNGGHFYCLEMTAVPEGDYVCVVCATRRATVSKTTPPPHYLPDLTGDDDVDVPCMQCGRADDEATFVLCDGCPNGGHCRCMGLTGVPEGDWYCAVCVAAGRAAGQAPGADGASGWCPPSKPRAGSWEVVGDDPREMASVAAELIRRGDVDLGRSIEAAAEDVAAALEAEARRVERAARAQLKLQNIIDAGAGRRLRRRKAVNYDESADDQQFRQSLRSGRRDEDRGEEGSGDERPEKRSRVDDARQAVARGRRGGRPATRDDWDGAATEEEEEEEEKEEEEEADLRETPAHEVRAATLRGEPALELRVWLPLLKGGMTAVALDVVGQRTVRVQSAEYALAVRLPRAVDVDAVEATFSSKRMELKAALPIVEDDGGTSAEEEDDDDEEEDNDASERREDVDHDSETSGSSDGKRGDGDVEALEEREGRKKRGRSARVLCESDDDDSDA